MSLRLLVIAPGRQAGGANLLLARSAAYLARRHGFNLSLVDFDDGATRALWTSEGIPFEFKRYEVGGDIEIGQSDAIIISLLGAKLFPSRLKGNLGARLIAWCTAPQDAFKFFPAAYFFNNSSWETKSRIARVMFPSHRLRIAKFLSDGANRGGVIFMDEHCHAVNERLFGPGIRSSITSICTGMPELSPRNNLPKSGKAYWVGRIADFKTEAFIAMSSAILSLNSSIKEVIVIGDGADLQKAEHRLSGLPITWRGYVGPRELDSEIFTNADLVFGHGTALLEAAKLGIPSLLVDGTYEKLDPLQVRAEWLHNCPPGYVMKIAPANGLIGRHIKDCLDEFDARACDIALADYKHWEKYHHPQVIAEKLAEVIARGDYTCRDFLNSGAADPGLIGGLMEWIKANVFRRQY